MNRLDGLAFSEVFSDSTVTIQSSKPLFEVALLSPEDLWMRIFQSYNNKPISWIEFKLNPTSRSLSCKINEKPYWVQQQLAFDSQVRRQFPESCSRENTNKILTPQNDAFAKRMVDEDNMEQRVRQEERSYWREEQHTNACRPAFLAKFEALFEGSRTIAQCVPTPKQGWTSNMFLFDPETKADLSPLDVFQQIFATRARTDVFCIKKIQFWIPHDEDHRLLYYNVNEECDALEWENEEQRVREIELVKAQRAAKRPKFACGTCEKDDPRDITSVANVV